MCLWNQFFSFFEVDPKPAAPINKVSLFMYLTNAGDGNRSIVQASN